MSEPMELRGVDLVVIPAYQPSALLLDLVKDVTAAGYGAVVVDDGSTMDRQWIFAQLDPCRRWWFSTTRKTGGRGPP